MADNVGLLEKSVFLRNKSRRLQGEIFVSANQGFGRFAWWGAAAVLFACMILSSKQELVPRVIAEDPIAGAADAVLELTESPEKESSAKQESEKEASVESEESDQTADEEADAEVEDGGEIEQEEQPKPSVDDSEEEPAEKKDGDAKKKPPEEKKRVIGATAEILEKQSGLLFKARVDTGAKSCSLHVEEMEIVDEEKGWKPNVGKVIRFKVNNGGNKTDWLDRRIDSYVIIKTSGNRERRYKVPLTLRWKGVEKKVLVTLNDRNGMDYPLLLGRNFLRGDFLVDVEINSDD